MTAHDRLLALRRDMTVVLVLRALLAAMAVGIVTLEVARAAGMTAAVVIAVLFALAAGARMIVPVRTIRSLERVALWVEERHPALRYAVVTAAAAPSAAPAVESQAVSLDWWTSARRALYRSLSLPAAALLGAVALVAVLPRAGGSRPVGARIIGSAVASPRGGPTDVLARVRVRIVPPAYAGRRATTTDDPTSVEALVGSSVTVSGDGEASRVSASVDIATRAVTSRDAQWVVALAMPGRPALLRLRADGAARERLIVLAPVLDAAPAVTLLLPARDTVVRAATGTLLLSAQLRDDIGLRDAAFELVVSSGQDENFTFRTTTLARTALGNAADRQLSVRLSLDSLALKPGDMVQMRAVARDGNTVTGPGLGSSETRALRVARAGEYDSVAVDPAPPPEPEAQVLSQRMIINLTEALERRRSRLPRAVLIAEAQRIASDQGKLRKRVGDIVFQRTGGEPLSEEVSGELTTGKLSPEDVLKRADEATRSSPEEVMDVEGDETPILSINKPLLEAFNAMWDAGRALEQGETNRALPPMRRALAAIERARQAERIYLRGRPSAVVVDLARVRMTGKDKGAATIREPRPPADPTSRRRAASFARATELLATDPSAAADTLLVMRVDALERAPALAAALDEAARALRRGDASAIPLAWQRVRRALGPLPVRRDGIGLWSGSGAASR